MRFYRTTWARLAVVVLLVVAGCARATDRAAQIAEGPTAVPQPLRVDDGQLVSDQTGWVRSGSELYITTNAGASWRRVDLPADPPAGRVVALSGPEHFMTLGLAKGHLSLFETDDGGAKWRETPLAPNRQLAAYEFGPGSIRADLETSGTSSAGALVSVGLTDSYHSVYFATREGRTWTHHDAPGGRDGPGCRGMALATDGTAWLACGGVVSERLYRTTDEGATWTPISLSVAGVPAGGTVAISAPRAFRGGPVILPLTTASPDGTGSARFFVSRDGGQSFSEAARVALETGIGAGVAAPAAVVAPDFWVVAEPSGSRLYTFTGSARPTVVSPNGLSQGVDSISFATPSKGWAVTTTRTCDQTAPNGKGINCTNRSGIVATGDGGENWEPLSPA